MQVKTFILDSSEVISEYREEGDFFILKNPRVIQVIQTQNGPQPGIVPAFMTAKKNTEIKIPNTVLNFECAEEIVDAYKQEFSNIELPKKSSIIA